MEKSCWEGQHCVGVLASGTAGHWGQGLVAIGSPVPWQGKLGLPGWLCQGDAVMGSRNLSSFHIPEPGNCFVGSSPSPWAVLPCRDEQEGVTARGRWPWLGDSQGEGVTGCPG